MKADDKRRLGNLQDLAQMVLDAKLADLRLIVRARDASLAHLAELNRPFAETDLNPIAEAEAAIRFQRWADMRRAEVNQILARQTAMLHEMHSATQTAFGRANALAKLRNGLKTKGS